MDDELYEKGIAIREEMLGPEHGRAKVESQPDGSLLVCEQVTSSLIRIRPDGLRQVVAFHYQGKYL
jgi:hypothetical protein